MPLLVRIPTATICSKVHDLLKVQQSVTDAHSKIVELLDKWNIQHSSIDIVCFSWVEDYRDFEDFNNYKVNKGNEDNVDVEHVDIVVPCAGWLLPLLS